MDQYLWIAGMLCVLLGLAHSFLGEFLIFKKKKKPGKFIPTIANTPSEESHLRIIWATWHLTSIFGGCMGVILVRIATTQNQGSTELISFITVSTAIAMLCASFLVGIATKGKHPGWVILLIIGFLVFLN
jgi:hypothetical protein